MRLWAAGAGMAVILATGYGAIDAFEYADDRIAAGAPAWHTPVDLARGPDHSIYIAARDSGEILRLSQGMAKPERWASVDRLLHNIAVDGQRLYASVGHADGEVVAFDLATAQPVWRTKVGHTPRTIAARGDALFVACQHENDVAALDASGKVLRRFPVEREPVDLALTPDGAKLVVVNQLPSGTADRPGVAAAVNLVDLRSGMVSRIGLAPGAHSAQSVAISRDGRTAFVPSILSNYHLPTSQIERGWIQMAGLNVIDLTSGKLKGWFLLDDAEKGAANPWDCVVLEDGSKLAISLSGTHEVMFIDLDELGKLSLEQKDEAPRQLGELAAIRKRVPLPGEKSPRPLLPVGPGVWYGASYSDAVGFVVPGGDRKTARYDFSTKAPLDPVRRGEIAFHDATLSAQQWLSCSSCHPGNARVDALNWDLLNDGIGTYKNTKSLVGSHETPPTTWTGVRANAHVSVRAGMTHILFMGNDEGIAEALDAWLSRLKPLPSPHIAKADQDVVAKGRTLFTERGCVHCHDGPHLTNMKAFDVGTGRGREEGKKFDVPTLREIWRTAPYLHDGRAETIEDAIAELHKDERFREKSGLQEDEIADIAAYLRTL